MQHLITYIILSTIGLYAVNNNQSYESDTVKAVDDDIKHMKNF